jgi:hypothetical protein
MGPPTSGPIMEDEKQPPKRYMRNQIPYASIFLLSIAAGATLSSATLPKRDKVQPLELALTFVLSALPIEDVRDCTLRIANGENHHEFRHFGFETLQLSNGIAQNMEVGVNVAGPRSTFPNWRNFDVTITPKLLQDSALIQLAVKVGERRVSHSLSLRPSEIRMIEVTSSKGRTFYLICDNRTRIRRD